MTSEKKKELIRALKFILFSISAGFIQIVSFTLLEELTPWTYWPCHISSLTLSVIWNFTFNRKFTFKAANNVPIAMLKTLAFYAVFTPATALLGQFLTETWGWNSYAVEAINMILNFVLEYLYQRFFVFGKSIDTMENKDEQ